MNFARSSKCAGGLVGGVINTRWRHGHQLDFSSGMIRNSFPTSRGCRRWKKLRIVALLFLPFRRNQTRKYLFCLQHFKFWCVNTFSCVSWAKLKSIKWRINSFRSLTGKAVYSCAVRKSNLQLTMSIEHHSAKHLFCAVKWLSKKTELLLLFLFLASN